MKPLPSVLKSCSLRESLYPDGVNSDGALNLSKLSLKSKEIRRFNTPYNVKNIYKFRVIPQDKKT
jgi:hypothetical protein